MFEREEEERAQAKAREITAKVKSGQHSEHVTKMVGSLVTLNTYMNIFHMFIMYDVRIASII